MSTLRKEAHNIIDSFPEDKMKNVLIALKNISDIINEPDDYDYQLMNEAVQDKKKWEFTPIEQVAKDLGIELNG